MPLNLCPTARINYGLGEHQNQQGLWFWTLETVDLQVQIPGQGTAVILQPLGSTRVAPVTFGAPAEK